METFFARRAASILALLAFAVAAATGVASRVAVTRVVVRSLAAMAIFYAIGYFAGRIGCWIVAEGGSKEPLEKDLAEKAPEIS